MPEKKMVQKPIAIRKQKDTKNASEVEQKKKAGDIA
jgi:hypothetical protein